MAVTSGFFNSSNHDRTYSNMDMGRMFDGVITDGVFAGVGSAFLVEPLSGMTVVVGTGRAWFNHTWTYNDAALSIEIPTTSSVTPQYDFICIKVDTRDSVRQNSIVYTESTSSSAYFNVNDLTDAPIPEGVYYYPIARIYRTNSTAEITAENITRWIDYGDTSTPYAKAAVDNLDVSVLMAQYNQQFMDWWNGLQQDLGPSDADVLQGEISQLRTDLSAEALARQTRDEQLTANGNGIIQRTTLSQSYTVASNAAADLMFNLEVPEGYAYLGIGGFDSGYTRAYITYCGKYDDTHIRLIIHNDSTSSITKTATLTVTFIKTDWTAPSVSQSTRLMRGATIDL